MAHPRPGARPATYDDLDGWRRERLPVVPDEAYFTLALARLWVD